MSRMCIIPFSKPSIAPHTDDEYSAFNEVNDMLECGQLSSVVGWVITQNKVMMSKED